MLIFVSVCDTSPVVGTIANGTVGSAINALQLEQSETFLLCHLSYSTHLQEWRMGYLSSEQCVSRPARRWMLCLRAGDWRTVVALLVQWQWGIAVAVAVAAAAAVDFQANSMMQAL